MSDLKTPLSSVRVMKISELTLMGVVVSIMMPAANYSVRLHDPTPPQLLVAICIAVFSSVVCLWILDAVSAAGPGTRARPGRMADRATRM